VIVGAFLSLFFSMGQTEQLMPGGMAAARFTRMSPVGIECVSIRQFGPGSAIIDAAAICNDPARCTTTSLVQERIDRRREPTAIACDRPSAAPAKRASAARVGCARATELPMPNRPKYPIDVEHPQSDPKLRHRRGVSDRGQSGNIAPLDRSCWIVRTCCSNVLH
jgi:hypothetical protein